MGSDTGCGNCLYSRSDQSKSGVGHSMVFKTKEYIYLGCHNLSVTLSHAFTGIIGMLSYSNATSASSAQSVFNLGLQPRGPSGPIHQKIGGHIEK